MSGKGSKIPARSIERKRFDGEICFDLLQNDDVLSSEVNGSRRTRFVRRYSAAFPTSCLSSKRQIGPRSHCQNPFCVVCIPISLFLPQIYFDPPSSQGRHTWSRQRKCYICLRTSTKSVLSHCAVVDLANGRHYCATALLKMFRSSSEVRGSIGSSRPGNPHENLR